MGQHSFNFMVFINRKLQAADFAPTTRSPRGPCTPCTPRGRDASQAFTCAREGLNETVQGDLEESEVSTAAPAPATHNAPPSRTAPPFPFRGPQTATAAQASSGGARCGAAPLPPPSHPAPRCCRRWCRPSGARAAEAGCGVRHWCRPRGPCPRLGGSPAKASPSSQVIAVKIKPSRQPSSRRCTMRMLPSLVEARQRCISCLRCSHESVMP